jgi:hypothetical protein
LSEAEADTAAPPFIFRLDKPKFMKMAHEEKGRILVKEDNVGAKVGGYKDVNHQSSDISAAGRAYLEVPALSS